MHSEFSIERNFLSKSIKTPTIRLLCGVGMRFLFLLFCFMKLSAEVIVIETAPNGVWLEAHINDDRTLGELIFSDGSSVLYEYESSRLQKITRFNSLGEPLYSQSYHFKNSQLDCQTGWFSTQYFYDDQGRVVGRFSPYLQETIEYDPLGQAVRIGERTYLYDDLGQVLEEQGCFQALYDANYHVQELNGQSFSPCQTKDFFYDEKDQLIEACGKQYCYDLHGRCVQKGNVYYLYLGFEEIASFEQGICKTLKIPGIGGPVSIEIDGKPYAPVVDAQGIIRKLIDPINDSMYAENDCDIFGWGLTEDIPYAYRGKRYDAETGLLYFGKRYYDPAWHCWMTPDPLGSIDNENLYQYVYNNPIRYSDPIGCSFWGYALGLGEIIAGGALMLTGGVIEVGSFGVLTLGFVVAESSGFALMADGWARATYESHDLRLPKREKETSYQFFKQGSIDPTLPSNPDDLLKRPGWQETTHPDAGKKGHRMFENQKTGEIIRHDEGKPGLPGHRGKNHYHHQIPDGKGGYHYVDGAGNPVPDHSDLSHLYPS